MHVLRGPQEALAAWVITRSGGHFIPGMATAIVVGTEDGKPVAGCAFTDFNGRNIHAHVVVDDPRATLLLFRLTGEYVFNQLRCARLTLVAEESNLKAVKLHEKLGAIREGRLVGAGRSGDDILVSRLTPDSRIWRKLSERGPKWPRSLAA